MSRVLVTGGTGFIGKHLLPLLTAAGHEVHATCSGEPPDDATVRWHPGSLLEEGAAAAAAREARADVLMHLAWYAEPGKYWTSPLNLRWVQVSLDLVQAFRAAGGRRAVIAGSCAEYDWEYGYCSESATPRVPTTLYGSAKQGLGTMIEGYARETGLEVAWGRLFFLYGPHEHPQRLVAMVIRALLAGTPAECSPGEQLRDFLHVRDAAGAFAALASSPFVGPVNIASGRPVRVRELIEEIAGQIGRPDLVRLGVMPMRQGDPPALLADIRRLRDSVGWAPSLDLATGIADTIAWWRNAAS